MVNKSTRGKLAKKLGITAGAVTKACDGPLKAALIGRHIDLDHPATINYIKNNADAKMPNDIAGIDNLYNEAVEWCRENKKWSISALQRQFIIGYERAKRIKGMMDHAGVVGSVPAPELDIQVLPRKLSGNALLKEQKKNESLASIDTDKIIHDIPDDIKDFADMTLREIITRFGTEFAFNDWLKATKMIEDVNEKRLKNAQTEGELVSRELVKNYIIEPIEQCNIKLLTDGARTIARRVTAMQDAKRPLKEIEDFVIDQISSFIKPVKTKVARALKRI